MVSDAEILKLLERRDRVAFNGLYENYAPLLYGWIGDFTEDKSIACNLLEKSFVDIWHSIKFYNPDYITLFAWLLRITMNNCLKILGLPSKSLSKNFNAFRYYHMEQ